jgi:hypothetical protein
MFGSATDTQKWVDEVKKYDYQRKNLQYKIEQPEIITHKKVFEMDAVYNPITQKYNNKEFDKELYAYEKQKSLDTIVKNADHALKLEQYFNVINLQDKLKGLEKHPDYPQPHIERMKKNLETSQGGYNLISNIGLDKHHFAKPELRPNVEESKTANKKIYAAAFSDYNNVYNRYLNNHEEKIRAEREAQQLEAANKYWQQNNYDPIKMRYIDQEKENEFQKKLKRDETKFRPKPDLNSFKG